MTGSVTVIVVALAALACSAPERGVRQPARAAGVVTPPTTDTRANPLPETGDWTQPAKDYANTRYSGLDSINASNVSRLALVSTFSTSVLRGHEAAPLVVNNTLYVVTPFPDILYAIDLTKPGWPVKWTYKPNPASAAQGVACCDVVNRGATYYDGALYYNTLDDHVVAVDANTGAERWNVKVGDINTGETLTMAPLVAKGKVIVGNSGGELGVRGWIQALDAKTGRTIWKAYATGPDKDVLIGPRFKPFYASDRGTDLGVNTWKGDQWKTGGGGAWGWVSFDPSLNLIYYGTANPGPWNSNQRPGDNKWTSTIFARDIDTGEAVWAYQVSPHDLHDYDAVNENVLLNLPIDGTTRKVLVHPDRDGYMYVIDRTNGQVLSTATFAPVNAVDSINMKTGRPANNPQKHPDLNVTVRDICPAPPGGKDWQPSAYSPRTGLLYVPHNNLCYDAEAVPASYIEGTPYVGMNEKIYAGVGGNGGVFSAWDPVHAREVWSLPERFPVWSGALVTAGDVVFYGTMDGWFKAVDARNGKLLWKAKTASGIVGQPTTFVGPDHKQYVAILIGVGGWAGAIVAGDLDPKDSTAGGGLANAMKDLPKYTTKGGALYVFGLK
jgi:lanthanide-dependent methanol dehydrogenase